MHTVRDFYTAKNSALASLDPANPTVYITSVNDPYAPKSKGVVVMASRDNAAHMMAFGTHRPSTPEEIAAHDKAEKEAADDAENKRVQPISAETIAAVARTVNEAGNKKKGD